MSLEFEKQRRREVRPTDQAPEGAMPMRSR